MSKLGRRKNRAAAKTSGRPSTFFIVAIVIGLALFAWMASRLVSRPVAVPTPPAHTSTK
jgi:hypothetical protein